jgi:ethanolamine ammonia-lyase large subunit
VFSDNLFDLCVEVCPRSRAMFGSLSVQEALGICLKGSEDQVRLLMAGLTSDVIACIVKICTDKDLITIGSRVFNPLPGTCIGAKGYLGARIQPNSPTDNPEDIVWQVMCGFSYAVGDVMLGTNPVSSDPESVKEIEAALKSVVDAFGLADTLPHCVLAHVDVQAQAEKLSPGCTALWFQSIAGSDSANQTFDLPVAKMLAHAGTRTGRFGLYLETGQGADFTNGHSHGYDMVLHDSRKYGFARALKSRVAAAQVRAGRAAAPMLYINDVAGFIGPEVFRSRQQLVRCCLEDIVMGKLHGLTIGLDVCTTLHMDVSLDDLDWCIDNIMPANPGYLMALPTKNDPMLGYLTTAFQDHVRIRERFGYKVDDTMWAFFKSLGVIGPDDRPSKHFGDPVHVYECMRRGQGDTRPSAVVRAEGEAALARVRSRGVPIASGHGESIWRLEPALEARIRELYDDAKTTLWHELTAAFIASIPGSVELATRSKDRRDYVWHPETGELLSDQSVIKVRGALAGSFNAVIVVSDGLCADAITDHGHLFPFLAALREHVKGSSIHLAAAVPVVRLGRVRAGYHIGEVIFGTGGSGSSSAEERAAIIHIIGERPGSGHHTFSAYLTVAPRSFWRVKRKVDHDITRVVSGIADTSYDPQKAASECVGIIKALMAPAKM